MRTVIQATAYLRAQVKQGARLKVGLCKLRTREAYGVASDGSPDATTAWRRTDHRVTGQWVWGAFLWWTGGSEGHGHVAVCRWRRGHIFTVDYPRLGHWNATTVDELEDAWPSIRYAGMSLDIDGVKVRRLPAVRRRWSHA